MRHHTDISILQALLTISNAQNLNRFAEYFSIISKYRHWVPEQSLRRPAKFDSLLVQLMPQGLSMLKDPMSNWLVSPVVGDTFALYPTSPCLMLFS